MNPQFEMVAKTFKGLEDVLAQELISLGASNVEPGLRMVSFEGDLAMMYRANLCCRTALRILKPIYKFIAADTDTLYDMVKEFDWAQVLSLDKTFAIDTTVNSDEFAHSRFVTYRVKDAIVDHFKDKFGPDKRPGVRQDADVLINVHISGDRVTLSLDSSGESLHKRGYRVAQTDAPINEVLAAGIILKTGWRGDTPFVDPMCGSGTFLVEAALIAANINPGVYRKGFAFEQWPDFDEELFESIYDDDSEEREPVYKIYGADISPKAIAIAQANAKQAGVSKYIDFEIRPIAKWEEAPEPAGVLVTNPPYGERISVDDMDDLYATIGSRLKHVFQGWHAWIIAPANDYVKKIGLAPSLREELMNGSIECELREYVIFDGDYNAFRREGGTIKNHARADKTDKPRPRRMTDKEWKMDARRKGFGGKEGRDKSRSDKPFRDRRKSDERPGNSREERFGKDRFSKDKFGKGRFDRDKFGKERFGKERSTDRSRGVDRDSRPARPRNPLEERYHSDRRRFNDPVDAATPLNEIRRRNEHALKSITGRQPSLPPSDGRIMRSRGWKKGGLKSPSDDTPADE
ncbi:MAG: THUMP domain-containing protein [Pseudoflavonifractor sp.]|nr:THUMP domain-containing protein [Pseudoflavonifractor sp.]